MGEVEAAEVAAVAAGAAFSVADVGGAEPFGSFLCAALLLSSVLAGPSAWRY